MMLQTDAPEIRDLLRKRYQRHAGRYVEVHEIKEYIEERTGRPITHRRLKALLRQVFPGAIGESKRKWLYDTGEKRQARIYPGLGVRDDED